MSWKTELVMAAAAVFAADACFASVVLLNTDFTNASPTSYGNASTINSDQLPVQQMAVAVGGSNVVQVGTVNGSNAVLLTDNTNGAGDCLVKKMFPAALSTTNLGNNYFRGTFDFTPLLASTTASANNPEMNFILNYQFDTGGGANIIQMQFRGNGTFTYRDGSTSVSGPTLTQNHTYRFSVYADLSSSTQDTWGFTAIDLTNANAPVADSGPRNTRAANSTPDRVDFIGSPNSGAYNPLPFAAFDNVYFEAMNISEVPEPGSLGLFLGMAATGLLARRRRTNIAGL